MAASTTRRSSLSLDVDGPETERCGDESDSLASRLKACGSRKAPSVASSVRGPISPPPLRRSRASPAAAVMLDSLSDKGQSPALCPGTPPPPPPLSLPDFWAPQAVDCGTPTAQTDSNVEWTIPEIAEQLNHFRQDVKDGHSQLTAYIIESTTATERRVHHGPDLFAAVKVAPVPEKKGTTMRIKSKQHLKAKRDHKEEHHNVVCIKTNKDRVPRYRFHHVGIKKNVLTPNTMLTFVPHLRDLESSEETKYNLWLKELEDIDLKSGFKPMNREEKQAMTFQLERAATISLYLETWLDNLVIPGCNKSALISYMASREPDDAITPQQKTDILRSHREMDSAASGASAAAQMFTDAFQLVFKDSQPPEKQIDLRKVLLLDESVDSIMDSKPTAKDGAGAQNDDEDELAEFNLATYCILGCLICFSHSCDHGEYDNKNLKRTFSISSCSHLSDALKRRRVGAGDGNAPSSPPCLRQCYRRGAGPFGPEPQPPWSEDEEIVLRSIFTTATHSAYKGDAICLAANFLDRTCSQAYEKFQSLGVSLPQPPIVEPNRVKNLSWYDRRRKILLGDWQDHTLCGTCGALERADPLNADDDRLHTTGCQNCDLQRGVGKSLILGQSQLEGVGYGLFTAEDIDQDDFIVEYVGELITHDEGVRREARRGDVFDEHSNISYVFTLLENEGIWVDAAIYGNLSRYINHASENDKRGCNITPRILYVNGEYRIKFTAMRDIQAGEELFFNYGENFPNLTKKLLDHKAGEQPAKAKGGRPRRAEVGDQVARKAPKSEQKRGPGRPKAKRDIGTDDDLQIVEPPNEPAKSRKRKRRSQDDPGEAEYHPPVAAETPKAAGAVVGLEDQSPDSISRLRKRTRAVSSSQPFAAEPKRAELPKKKGKRGGARPGSGRPRKHPRPAPKPVPAPKIKEEEETAEEPPPAPIAAPPEPAPGFKAEVVEIEDSDEGTTRGLHEVSVLEPMGEDAGDPEDMDEDEDQDVVVRKRNDRAVRNRRPPAKFREDEIWN
ncbi:SET domain-containing protein [Hirsutella rhossiliensis]|uniref:SET domain-containing protein n=1 Tax=Hirsutella rhossiliensis TaxID=111463 RepID=A0A9P8MY87_9HYPO|nr:SET domain-containing protein [Hirsutella rhossiliensis]KAH0962486.1 SET domain-containing protein [Hirsutella rhossiliensis]